MRSSLCVVVPARAEGALYSTGFFTRDASFATLHASSSRLLALRVGASCVSTGHCSDWSRLFRCKEWWGMVHVPTTSVYGMTVAVRSGGSGYAYGDGEGRTVLQIYRPEKVVYTTF